MPKLPLNNKRLGMLYGIREPYIHSLDDEY